MVRSCQFDDAIERYAGQLLQARAEPEVGLLLGRLNVGSKDVVLMTCKTPLKDGEPAFKASAPAAASVKKGAAKGKAGAVAAEMDAEWVAEHALQVSRMLPGGVSVVGLYLWAPDGALQSVVAALLDALESFRDLPGAAQDAPALVLLMASTTGQCSVKEVGPGARSTADAKPGELKFLPNLHASFVAVRSSFDLSAWLVVGGTRAPGSKALRSAVQSECERIQQSTGLVEGAEWEDDLLLNLPGASGGECEVGGLVVELLSPAPVRCAAEREGTAQGCLELTGWLAGVAMVHKRETVAAAVQLVKNDLRDNLMAREEILLEEVREAAAGTGDGGDEPSQPGDKVLPLGDGKRGRQLMLPQRVFITAKPPLVLCDLLVEGEGAQQAAEHMQELMGLKVDPDTQVVLVEAAAAPPFEPSWDPTGSTSGRQSPGTSAGSSSASALASVKRLVLILLWVAIAAMMLVAYLHNGRSQFDLSDEADDAASNDPLLSQETWE